MKDRDRMRRVNELIQREVSVLCEEFVVPNVDSLLTVTAVRTTPDLRQATVSVSVLGDDEQKRQVFRSILNERRHIQAELGQRIRLKYTPVLKFELDDRIAAADRIMGIIRELDLDDDSPASRPAPETDDDLLVSQ